MSHNVRNAPTAAYAASMPRASWDDVPRGFPQHPRYNANMEIEYEYEEPVRETPKYETRGSVEVIHPSIPRRYPIRQRGGYWWHTYKLKTEKRFEDGTLEPTVGMFYCFLSDHHRTGCDAFGTPHPGVTEHLDLVFLYGNVFMGDHWVEKSMAFLKDDPERTSLPVVYLE